ncbi:MAG TPA: hypothetical protein VK701_02970 [Solirubrobacteraceae bacterium]|jgi:hypothetical protein|nr:hypothetical protein [Solirubrobacteraceae bacterium]
MHDLDDYDELRDEKYHDAAAEDAQAEWFEEAFAERMDEVYAERFQTEVVERIDEVFDEHFEAIFRSQVESWSAKHWPPAETTAHRVGREARAFTNEGLYAPAVVWSATCVEIILRDLTLSPIFVGLFLGEQWADAALKIMLGNRWTRRETRAMARHVLHAIVGIDVDALEARAIRPWGEIDNLLTIRNQVVHSGSEVSSEMATWAVDVAAALYATLLPPLRKLCGLTEEAGYRAPEGGTIP